MFKRTFKLFFTVPHLYFVNGCITAMYLSVDMARVLNIEPI